MRISSFIQFKTLTNTLRYAIVHGHRTFTEIRSYLVLTSLFFDVSGSSYDLMRKMEEGVEPSPHRVSKSQNLKMSKCQNVKMSKCQNLSLQNAKMPKSQPPKCQNAKSQNVEMPKAKMSTTSSRNRSFLSPQGSIS